MGFRAIALASGIAGSARWVGFAAAALVASCASVIGLSDYEVEPDPTLLPDDGGSTTTPPVDGSSRVDGGSIVEASADVDASVPIFDESTCAPSASGENVVAHATAPSAIVIDGKTTDWPCAWRIHFDQSTAADGYNRETANASADFAVAWEPKGISFMARVHIVGALTTVNEVDIYQNESVELYIGSEVSSTGSLTAHDVHLIVDYANRAKLFGATSGDAGTLAIQTAVTTLPDGFAVEAFLPSTAFQTTPLADTTVLPFDLQVNHHLEGARRCFWLYQRTAPVLGGGACGVMKREPACDSTTWGRALLSP